MKSKRTKTREARLHSIAAYYDKADHYVEAAQKKARLQRIRAFSQEYWSDLHLVLQLLKRMPGTYLVIHGPRGCISTLPEDIGGVSAKSNWIVTDLNERDLILGGETKLRGAIQQLCEQEHPERIFVVTTPPVSINNDDAEALVTELETAYSIPILIIPATGFRSKLGTMGYDEALDALALLLPPPAE